MTPFEYLKNLHEVCHFQTREGAKVGLASNSELRRWVKNGAIVINGKKYGENEKIEFPIKSVVLFPKNRITIL